MPLILAIGVFLFIVVPAYFIVVAPGISIHKKTAASIKPVEGQRYLYAREGNAYDGFTGVCHYDSDSVSLFSGTAWLVAIERKSFKYLIKV